MKKQNKFGKILFLGLSVLALVSSTNVSKAVENVDDDRICRCHTAGEGVCLVGHAISFRSRCECLTEGIPGFCLDGGDEPETEL